MKIRCNVVEEFRSKIIWLHISLALVILTCYCFQGDDARPVLLSHVSPIACRVIFEKTHRRHVTKSCSCKCWIRCKATIKCAKWSLQTDIQLLQPQLSNHKPMLKFLATACSSCCQDKEFNSSILYSSIVQQDFTCNRNSYHANSSYCDNHIVNNSCCSVFCFSENTIGPCIYFYFDESAASTEMHSTYNDNLEESNSSQNNTKVFSRRRKRKSDFELPYHIEVLNKQKEFTVQEQFSIKVQITDKWGSVVPVTGRNVELRIITTENETKAEEQRQTFRTFLMNGQADFFNVSFRKTGNSYRLLVASLDSPSIVPWSSERLTVNYRPLTVRPSGRTLPISPRENDTMSPAAGVILYDVMNDKPANRSYLSQYVWECTISLLFDDVYPGKLLGTTSKLVKDGSNEIIFNDVVITEWGYSYILKIQITARETSYWNLTCLLGPFNVDILDTFEQPLVESDEYRKVKIVFDGDYDIMKNDEQKFEIFFLNHFGRKYSNVRWKNVTVSKGSIIVDAIIAGLTGNLDATSKSLETDIQNGKADVTYDQHLLKANQVFLPSRKLLEEKTDSEASDEGAGGLSVAWIVAIVVNVVLIVVFIIAIIYCYCRRKKHQADSRSSPLRNFDSGPNSKMYANKSENNGLRDKAAIFTVEDSNAKLGNHRSLSGKIHGANERCNCLSPTCYCSVGDGRKTEMSLQHSEEENEDDPQGYPTPSPEPKFPTPEPSPEPEDFWRPDSYPQQEEEEPEDEEMFLPGAVSDPSPDLPQEERFYVYLLTSVDGSRELVGQIYLKVDDFLNDTRRAIDNDRDLSDVIEGREYRFLDENLDAIPNYQESSLDLERIFPSQGINIQYLPLKAPTPKPEVPKRPQLPAYVGPLGICNAPDCTRAAKLKCLDCGNVAYCSKRCMREDARDHRRSCYKPAWRV